MPILLQNPGQGDTTWRNFQRWKYHLIVYRLLYLAAHFFFSFHNWCQGSLTEKESVYVLHTQCLLCGEFKLCHILAFHAPFPHTLFSDCHSSAHLLRTHSPLPRFGLWHLTVESCCPSNPSINSNQCCRGSQV